MRLFKPGPATAHADPQQPTPSETARGRLRVAVLSRVFSPIGGGAERYSIAMVEQLAQRHDFHVYAQQIDHAWPGVTYHTVSMPFARPSWVNQLWYATATWWATRRGFDIVHSHENTWHGNVQTVHVLPLKYKLFHGRHGWARAWSWFKVLASPRLSSYLLLEHLRYLPRSGRRIIVTSTMLEAVMTQAYPACAPTLTVITPGVTFPALTSDTVANKVAARRVLGLPEHARLIAFVANDYRKKGLTALMAALARLPDDCQIAVVGNSSQISEYRAVAERLRVGHRVRFLGALKDVSTFYQAADCLAHPTTEDSFAMVVLEAMAHGLPVVVSDARYCGIAAGLSQHVNAWVLQTPTDDAQLACAVRALLDAPELRARLSSGAWQYAQDFGWEGLALAQERGYLKCHHLDQALN